MDYYMEFGGGLGDVFYQMYAGGAYRFLEELGPQDFARIVLITHNPHVREIFSYHPRAGQIEVRDLGYWLPADDSHKRQSHGLPAHLPDYPATEKPVHFFAAPSDVTVLSELRGLRYVVFAASAGLPDRDVPHAMVSELAGRARARRILPVFVGRTYERHGRNEFRPSEGDGLDLVDRLTVPGVACLLEGALGAVCCHSAVNMLAWLMRKPQLLLYPRSVYEGHIARRDQWAFGIDFAECRHAQFDDPRVSFLADAFLDDFTKTWSKTRGPRNPSAAAQITTVPFPSECQSIELDETIPRLTSAKEVKFLCWLALHINGNIVEIGCNQGRTTKDLARTNPDKVVYAVDFLATRSQPNDWQRTERPSLEDFCVHARDMENVTVLHMDSSRINYEALRDVKLILIDGDHTLEGVRADTERARKFLESSEGGVLVWHDYYETAPSWVGVRSYVDSLDLDVHRVEGTWFALAFVPARRGSDSSKVFPTLASGATIRQPSQIFRELLVRRATRSVALI